MGSGGKKRIGNTDAAIMQFSERFGEICSAEYAGTVGTKM